MTASCGGLDPDEVFAAWAELEMVPFDPRIKAERRVRRLLGNVTDMRRPHFAYLGKQDELHDYLSSMQREAKRSAGKLTVVSVPGDHGDSVRPAIAEFLKVIQDTR
jgi:hypothetical protein